MSNVLNLKTFPCNYASVCIRAFLLLDFYSVYSAVRSRATQGSADGRRPHDVLRKRERGAQGEKPHVRCVLPSMALKGEGQHLSERPSTLPSLLKKTFKDSEKRTKNDVGFRNPSNLKSAAAEQTAHEETNECRVRATLSSLSGAVTPELLTCPFSSPPASTI